MTNVTWYRSICKKKLMFSAALSHEFHKRLFRRRTKKSLSKNNKLGLTTMFSDFNAAEIRSDRLKFVDPSLKRDELGGFFGITYLGSAFIVLNEKMAVILPTGQWYTPSAVINDAWYCRVLQGIAWYCMALHDIAWYCMVWHGFAWYCMVLHGIAWYCMILHCIAWYCMVLHGFA